MLVHLDLRKADVGGKEQGLLNVLKACSALVFLELSDVENVQHWSDIFKSLNNNKELKHLGIGVDSSYRLTAYALMCGTDIVGAATRWNEHRRLQRRFAGSAAGRNEQSNFAVHGPLQFRVGSDRGDIQRDGATHLPHALERQVCAAVPACARSRRSLALTEKTWTRWVEMGAVGATTLSSMLRQHAQLQHLIVDHIE
eukprot:219459-Rhodomonas_salina.2